MGTCPRNPVPKSRWISCFEDDEEMRQSTDLNDVSLGTVLDVLYAIGYCVTTPCLLAGSQRPAVGRIRGDLTAILDETRCDTVWFKPVILGPLSELVIKKSPLEIMYLHLAVTSKSEVFWV